MVRMALFLLLVLMVAGVFLLWRHSRQPAQVINNYTTIEADKRKRLGASAFGYGLNFAW